MENQMRTKILVATFSQITFACLAIHATAQAAKTAYPAMAPLEKYLIPDQSAEVALARTAAPTAISDAAEVMVLTRDGFNTAAKGTNGFVCVVERGWGAATTDEVFWNPNIRAPICFNPQAAKTFLPIFLMKTKLVLAGKSKAEILEATKSAFEKQELPQLEPGAMCYMMSKQQYLSDAGTHNWHPHLMFFVAGDEAKTWGADVEGSPVMAAPDPEERATIFMVWVGTWSDHSPAPPMDH
jgi:hypothetical protein